MGSANSIAAKGQFEINSVLHAGRTEQFIKQFPTGRPYCQTERVRSLKFRGKPHSDVEPGVLNSMLARG